MSFKFEQLRVWQSALDITLRIHNITRDFLKEEMYVLSSQIKRAADSVCLNIAEGSTGQSNAEQNNFLGYALRSAIEVVTCLHIGKKRDLIKEEDFQQTYQEIETLIVSIQAFRKSINP